MVDSAVVRRMSRRGGAKRVWWRLGILSYECRTAFHQCYSGVWCYLLPYLAQKYGMDDHSIAFHRLWHLDQREPSNFDDYHLHLFHGHVFALHSATGSFVNTKTGGELMATWLKERGDGPAFRRLLYGLLVAIHHYAGRNDIYALLRKKSPHFLTDEGLGQKERDAVERRTGRRPRR